jgi:hypothetical protein
MLASTGTYSLLNLGDGAKPLPDLALNYPPPPRKSLYIKYLQRFRPFFMPAAAWGMVFFAQK